MMKCEKCQTKGKDTDLYIYINCNKCGALDSSMIRIWIQLGRLAMDYEAERRKLTLDSIGTAEDRYTYSRMKAINDKARAIMKETYDKEVEE